MTISELWTCEDENKWQEALMRYWNFVRPKNIKLEIELSCYLNPDFIKNMDADQFYNFLLNKYFKWKYTAPNRYKSTTIKLNKYQNDNLMNELIEIKNNILNFDKNNIKNGLEIITKIEGLGAAGGSGLLALLFPKYFGTVDQFVVKALREISSLPERDILLDMTSDSLRISNAVVLIEIMRRKANELNRLFGTDFWTPRKIDMVLWTYGRN